MAKKKVYPRGRRPIPELAVLRERTLAIAEKLQNEHPTFRFADVMNQLLIMYGGDVPHYSSKYRAIISWLIQHRPNIRMYLRAEQSEGVPETALYSCYKDNAGKFAWRQTTLMTAEEWDRRISSVYDIPIERFSRARNARTEISEIFRKNKAKSFGQIQNQVINIRKAN